MRVNVDICLIPIGVGTSLSAYVAACQGVFRDAGLSTRLHAFGTNVEGEWDEVMAAVKACHVAVHAMGAVRISSTLKIGTRTDRVQSLDDKVRSVEQRLS